MVSVRPALEQRDQHLIERGGGRPVLRSDLAQRVTGLHGVAVARGDRGRARRTRRRRSRRRARGGRGRRLGSRRRRRGHRRRRHRRGSRGGRRRGLRNRRQHIGLRAQRGRVEQHGVLAQHAPSGPGQFEQHIEERLVDGLQRRDAHDVVAVSALVEIEAQRRQGRIEVEIGLAEGRLRGQPHGQGRRFVARHGGHFHFGAQRLAESRLHGQPTEPGRVRGGRSERKAQRKCERTSRRCARAGEKLAKENNIRHLRRQA